MFDNATTRLYPAMNNVRDTVIFSDFPVPDRIDVIHEYPQDFDDYFGPATTAASPAGGWTLSGAGGTAALVAGDGGILSVVAAVSTFAAVQKTPAAFPMSKGKRAWFTTQMNVDSVLGLVIAGLLNATATPFTGASQTDGAYFLSTNTGALSFNVAVGGVISSVNILGPTGAAIALVPGAVANANLSFYYDGGNYAAAPLGRVVWQVDGPGVTANARGEIAIPAAGTIAAFPGAVNLAPIVGVSASTAVARTLLTDKLYAAKDELNILSTPPF
jgi:hypothetical protein